MVATHCVLRTALARCSEINSKEPSSDRWWVTSECYRCAADWGSLGVGSFVVQPVRVESGTLRKTASLNKVLPTAERFKWSIGVVPIRFRHDLITQQHRRLRECSGGDCWWRGEDAQREDSSVLLALFMFCLRLQYGKCDYVFRKAIIIVLVVTSIICSIGFLSSGGCRKP
jgi:hypothetical protein